MTVEAEVSDIELAAFQLGVQITSAPWVDVAKLQNHVYANSPQVIASSADPNGISLVVDQWTTIATTTLHVPEGISKIRLLTAADNGTATSIKFRVLVDGVVTGVGQTHTGANLQSSEVAVTEGDRAIAVEAEITGTSGETATLYAFLLEIYEAEYP